MKLNLISKIGKVQNNFVKDELSLKSYGFYIDWAKKEFSTEKFFWRIVGGSANHLLSFEFSGGLLCAIEPLITPSAVVINSRISYHEEMEIQGTPVMGLIPVSGYKSITHDTGVVDVLIDFSVEEYFDCIRFNLGAVEHHMYVNKNIALEFSKNFDFVGISIVQN